MPFSTASRWGPVFSGGERLHPDLRVDAQRQSRARFALSVRGYVGYAVSVATGSWILSFVARSSSSPLLGVAMQILVFRRMEGQDLRQTMVTIGLSIVFADLMLWAFAATSIRSRRRARWLADHLAVRHCRQVLR